MEKDHFDQEWENRVLCSDESCIGVIGSDGRCKECGLAYEGKLPSEFSAHHVNADASEAADEAAVDDGVAVGSEEQDATQNTIELSVSDDEWANRKLCRDESCIGIIGPDGRCKECGLAYDK